MTTQTRTNGDSHTLSGGVVGSTTGDATTDGSLWDALNLAREGASWAGAALCAQTDPDLFFPERGGASVAAAKRVCLACPVRSECLDAALRRRERFGVWGGLSERERRALLRARGVDVDQLDEVDDDEVAA